MEDRDLLGTTIHGAKILFMKITAVDFRNKTKYGWADYVETLYFDNGDSVDSRIV